MGTTVSRVKFDSVFSQERVTIEQIGESAYAGEQHGQIGASVCDSGITGRHRRVYAPLSAPMPEVPVHQDNHAGPAGVSLQCEETRVLYVVVVVAQ